MAAGLQAIHWEPLEIRNWVRRGRWEDPSSAHTRLWVCSFMLWMWWTGCCPECAHLCQVVGGHERRRQHPKTPRELAMRGRRAATGSPAAAAWQRGKDRGSSMHVWSLAHLSSLQLSADLCRTGAITVFWLRATIYLLTKQLLQNIQDPLFPPSKFQYFGHLMRRADSFEKTLMLGKIEGRRRRDNRGWDG